MSEATKLARAARVEAYREKNINAQEEKAAEEKNRIDLTSEDSDPDEVSGSQSKARLPVIQETAEDVVAMTMEALVSPDTLQRQVSSDAEAKRKAEVETTDSDVARADDEEPGGGVPRGGGGGDVGSGDAGGGDTKVTDAGVPPVKKLSVEDTTESEDE